MSDAREQGNAAPDGGVGHASGTPSSGDEAAEPRGLGEGSAFGAGWGSTTGSSGGAGSWANPNDRTNPNDHVGPTGGSGRPQDATGAYGGAAPGGTSAGNSSGPFTSPTSPFGAAPGQQSPDAPGPYGNRQGPYGNPQGPYGNPQGQGPFAGPQGPYGYPGAQPYGQVPGYGYGYAGPPQTDSGARNSLILSIVGIFICGILLGPAAIVEGVKARKRIRLSNGRLTGDGLAIAGIVIGIITLAIYAIYIVIVIIAASKSPSSRLR